jgi:hypothetical protein
MAVKAARESGVSAASAPPATTASASPERTSRIAAPIASVPAAQADTLVCVGPCRPWRMASPAVPALAIMSGTASGETRSGPLSRSTSCWPSSVSIPPIPVPTTQPTRSESYGRSPFHPACSSASWHAPTASCRKRSLRRTSFVDMYSVGSKSLHGASPFS